MCPYITIGSLRIGSFLIFAVLGFIAAFALVFYRTKQRQMSPFIALHLLIIFVAGIYFGSKIYTFVTNPSLFFEQPMDTLFSLGGFGWFGGYIMSIVTTSLYARFRGYSMLEILDVVTPGVPLGAALGRMGCFMSGDGCYGIPTEMPWGMSFPEGMVPTLLNVHPTQLYEIVTYLLILGFLLYLDRQKVPSGTIFATYLIFSSMARFTIEYVRLSPITLWGHTTPQFITAGLFTFGLVILVFLYKRRNGTGLFPVR